METLFQDVRFGIRMMWKAPTITLVAVLTLALGIGANTTIFSALNGLILRPLPVAHADRLVVLGAHQDGVGDFSQFAYADFDDLRSQHGPFSEMLAYEINLAGVDLDGKVEPTVVNFVSGNFFRVLGLKPVAGRMFYGTDTEKPSSTPVVVLSYEYWKKRLNGDPGAIGRQLKLNGRAVRIVGVAPESFHGLYSLIDTQFYLPLGIRGLRTTEDHDFWTRRNSHDLRVLGVLRPGTNVAQAQSFVTIFAQQLTQQYPDTHRGITYRVYPERSARPDPGNGIIMIGVLFLFLSGLVLLLACTNVTNIILVRASGRQHEMAMRSMLGASTLRMVRQFLVESIMLGILGGSAGLAAAAWASHALGSIRIAVASLPIHFDFRLDWRVYLFALTVVIVAGLLVGIGPAWKIAHADLSKVLHAGSRGLLGGVSGSRFRNALVVAQVSASLLLLVVAGLFVRSAVNAEHTYLGFDPTHVLNMTMDTRTVGFDAARSQQFFRELQLRVAALPGVESASLASFVPMGYTSSTDPVYLEGSAVSTNGAAPDVLYNVVTPLYFKTMRVSLVSGRGFTDQDDKNTPPVAVVNETMARRYWPNQNVIGQHFSVKGPAGPFIEIVGLVKDGKYESPVEDPQPFYYVPRAQNESTFGILQIRTIGAPESLIKETEQLVQSLAPGLPLVDLQTMEQSLQGVNGFFLFHLGVNLTGILGLIGLILATVGVYGVISYVAARRTHEIGIRMALGASRNHIFQLVLRRGLILVGAGVLTGLGLTLVVSRSLAAFMVGIAPTDPPTLFAASLVLIIVGLIASFIPARRAMRIEPLRSLKYE
jgi:predicted permease